MYCGIGYEDGVYGRERKSFKQHRACAEERALRNRLNRADCPWEYHAEQTNEPGGLRFDYYPLQGFAGENAETFFQSFSDRLKRNVADSGSTILAQYDFKPESLMLAYSWGDVTFQVADGKLSSAGCSLQPVSDGWQ